MRIGHQIVESLTIATVPILFTVCFTRLSTEFSYPDILRRPPSEILVRFQANSATLLPLWWGMMLAALVFIPANGLVLEKLRANLSDSQLRLATGFGVLAGLVQALGLSRWIFIVPEIATRYAAAAAESPTRSHFEGTFLVFHQWLGAGVGEWMGYLFTSAWTLIVAKGLWPRSRFLSFLGATSALGIATGLLEPFGTPYVSIVNAIAYTVWSIWILVIAFVLPMSLRPIQEPK